MSEETMINRILNYFTDENIKKAYDISKSADECSAEKVFDTMDRILI